MTSFYSDEELEKIGFASVGSNVLVSKKASIYSPEKIFIGNHVRIDDFCILSGKIKLGSYIHISAYTAIYGSNYGVELKDFSTVSAKCMIFSESDDYSGNSLTNPMVNAKYRFPYGGKITLEKHALVGAGCVILPAVTIEEGACVGAMSLVVKDVPSWTVNVGVPCRVIKERARKIMDLEKEMMQDLNKE
jgi:galactoside O-acetyltransferase